VSSEASPGFACTPGSDGSPQSRGDRAGRRKRPPTGLCAQFLRRALSTSRYRWTHGTPAISAADLLREARLSAGLSQTELAQRATVTQSVVSAYETGSREPSLPMLIKFVGATGKDLDIRVRSRSRPLTKLRGPLGRCIRKHRSDLVAAAARHGATNLRVFGSVARGEESAPAVTSTSLRTCLRTWVCLG
jgi:transcriptional regulator with XRE-family HTH domain